MTHKLYILIRKDMSHEQRAVQAGHAVADFCYHNHDLDLGWDNGTLIYLQVSDAKELKEWQDNIRSSNNFTDLFYDPDLHEGPTALFAYGRLCEDKVKDLPLMRFNIE